jgi:hypothetical protein
VVKAALATEPGDGIVGGLVRRMLPVVGDSGHLL